MEITATMLICPICLAHSLDEDGMRRHACPGPRFKPGQVARITGLSDGGTVLVVPKKKGSADADH
jgi:hypothetical protein